MDMKCSIPVFSGDKEILRDEKRATVFFSLKPELTCCEINSVELYKDEHCSLCADFKIPYQYDQERKLLMVSAPDYEGEQRFQTIFHKEGGNAALCGADEKEKLEEWSKESVRSIYREITSQAEKEKLTMFVRCNWDEKLEKELGIGCLKSTFGGVFECFAYTQFWNVIGSTSDAKFDKSWLKALNAHTEKAYKDGIITIPPQYQCIAGVGTAPCGRKDLVGGHIVFDASQVKPVFWAGGTPPHGVVGLLPICHRHNNSSNIGAMTAAVDCPGIWLDNYSGKD